ncbi:MAG: hypothetical protein V7711_19040 [Pseudomonadales bacterium]
MSTRMVLLGLLLGLVGCVAPPPPAYDYFANESEFAADREIQSMRFSDVDYDAMLGHVIDVLMDLDCALQESSKSLGVVSAGRGGYQSITTPFRTDYFSNCPLATITVVVTGLPSDELQVRASSYPVNSKTQHALKQLLDRSLELAQE